MSVAVEGNEYLPNNGNINDKIKINNNEIQLNVAYNLITGDNEYYEIKTRKGINFKIDKKDLLAILFYIDGNQSYIPMNWEADRHNKKFIMAPFENSYINITNYLKKDYTNLTNKKLNVKFINNDYYDFRSTNIEYINVLGKNNPKFKTADVVPEYFNDDTIEEIKIIEEYNGHKISTGTKNNAERNKYKLIEVIKKDKTKYRYYKIELNKVDNNNNEYTFLIDEEDKSLLETLYFKNNKVYYKRTDIPDEEHGHLHIINNPTWRLLDNQYVATTINKKGYDLYLVYIHRLLVGCQKTNNNTVDHINGNKFDNRKANLRITTMSVQNQNRDLVKREKNLNYYLNPENKTDIPKLSFDNLLFISFRDDDNNEYFDIEFKKGRCGTNSDIKKHSTKAVIFNDDKLKARRVKLCHAICIKYLTAIEYPKIIAEKIDNKKFDTLENFRIYSNTLITEIMGSDYTIDTFLDYMKTLQIPKYTDPRINNINTSINIPITEQKFNYINYNSSRDKYNAEAVINKKNTPDKKIKLDGSGSKNLTTEDKKCFALAQRYNLFITLENDINTKIHGEIPFTGEININTSNLKSLTDFEFTLENKKKFTNFIELRTYTEDCINKFLIPTTPFNLESFAKYINEKSKSKKVNLQISNLKFNYPVLISN